MARRFKTAISRRQYLKPPDACQSLGEIRCEIDRLDGEMIRLLGQRLAYVLAAAQFKKNEEDIPAPERVRDMLADRRTWAKKNGLSENFIEALFEQITSWYIATQIGHWRKIRGQIRDSSHG